MPRLTKQTQEFTQLLLPFERLDVRVIGVVEAGCSALNRLNGQLRDRVTMLGVDTGPGVNNLPESAASASLGDGFGSGGDPQAAAADFEEIAEQISTFVRGADVIVMVAGLGRGAGSGVSPLVAGIARQAGALTLAVVSMPFEFEGRSRIEYAEQALIDLRVSSDYVFTKGNDIVVDSAKNGSSLSDVFEEANRAVSNSINAIVTSFESSEGRFGEISGSLRNLGISTVATGLSGGLHAGKSAAEIALNSLVSCGNGPELSEVESVLIHVEGGIGMSAGQIAEVVTTVRVKIGGRAVVHVSSSRELTLGSTVRATLVLSAANAVADRKLTPDRRPAPEFVHIDTADSAVLSIFETPRPIRKRGPMLLPVG
jgi:cell division protein FtsZ